MGDESCAFAIIQKHLVGYHIFDIVGGSSWFLLEHMPSKSHIMKRHACFLLYLGCIFFLSIFFFSGVACVQMSIPLVRTISFCFRMISAKIFFGFITKVIEIMCKPAWSIWFWPSPFALYVNRLLNQGLMKQLPKSTMLHGWKL